MSADFFIAFLPPSRLEQLLTDFAEWHPCFHGKAFYNAGAHVMLGVLFDLEPCNVAAGAIGQPTTRHLATLRR
jgi:hypothetical protein